MVKQFINGAYSLHVVGCDGSNCFDVIRWGGGGGGIKVYFVQY